MPPPSSSVSGQAKNGCIKRMMGDNSLNSPETLEIEEKSFNENHPPPPSPIRRNLSTSSRTPNYLKASTGSCHDFCKFGKAYSNESKPRIPFQRRAASKSADDQVFARRNNATLPQVKKRAITLRSKSFPAPQSCNLDHISNVRKEKLSQLDRRKLLVNGLRVPNDTLVSKPSSSSLRKPQSPLVIGTFKKVLSQRKERRLSVNPISLPVKSIYVTTRRVSSSVKNKEDVNENKSLSSSSTSRRRNIEPKKPIAATLSLKPFMGKRRTIKSVDPIFSVGKRFILRKETAANKEKKAREDVAAVDKAGKYNKEESCQSLPITELVDQDKIDNNEYMVEIPFTAMSHPNSSALSFQEEEESCQSLPITELVDDQDQIDNNDEILVTAMSVPNSPALSFQEEDQMENNGTCSKTSPCQMISSSLKSMEEEECVMDNGNSRKVTSSSEIQEEEDETDVHSSLGGTTEYPVSDFDENEVENQEATRSKAIRVEEEDAKPVKLKFRRGKFVELQSESDNTPIRLRFRSLTKIGEKQDGNAVALKKIIMDRVSGLDGGGDEEFWLKNGCDAKVVLKRSDHQRNKKEVEASLLNNVIKETASKLVETRKSKVKALVGAFETVMSFSDTKPSTASPII